MKQCTFKFTNAFFKTFDIVADHLIYYNSQSHVPITQAKEAILKAQQVIEQHPQAYPINQEIAKYGLTYREANVQRGKNGFRILYSITHKEDDIEVIFELFLLQKMSVQKALTQFLLSQ